MESFEGAELTFLGFPPLNFLRDSNSKLRASQVARLPIAPHRSTMPARPRIPRSVWLLGFVSLLMDTSSEMIHSLLPVFMVSTLGMSALGVGFIEGLAEATALIVKVFSGTLSDYLGKRKTLTVVGYGLGAITKPVFALANGVGWILTARVVDRIGKGIRGAPRDALVADLTAPEIRGAAYGLRQSLDTIGAFAGPILALALMVLWSNDFRAVFWIAVIPAVLATALLLVGVKEPARPRAPAAVRKFRWRSLREFSPDFWWLAGLGGLFTLARFSEAFLVLRGQQSGLPVALAPLVLIVMNLAYSASAYPIGKLADTFSRPKLLIIGLLALFTSDLLLAFSLNRIWFFVGIAVWGLHLGLTQGVLAAMVADSSPEHLRGSAFGFFNLISGVALLIASVLAGWIWDRFGAPWTFGVGAGFCVLVLILLGARSSMSVGSSRAGI